MKYELCGVTLCINASHSSYTTLTVNNGLPDNSSLSVRILCLESGESFQADTQLSGLAGYTGRPSSDAHSGGLPHQGVSRDMIYERKR